MKQKVFRLLADLRFSIFILLVISFCSVIGTIIEQDLSIETYKAQYPITRPLFGIVSWNLILNFGLNHVYQTWWFLSLLFIFSVSLSLCSLLQQLPSLKIARRCQFFRKKRQFYRLKISTIINSSSFPQLLYRIKNEQYSVFHQQNILYCYKGLIGRIAPIIVHFSMILTLFGIIVSALFGFKAQEIVPKTENFHIQNLINTAPFTRIYQTSGRINDFWITYTKQKTIAQFYSNLSLLDKNGSEVKQRTIYVNSPLVYKGVYFYQTDWNLISLRLQNNQKQILEYPLTNVLNNQTKVWLSWISLDENPQSGLVLIIENLEGYCSLYNEKGQFIGNLELNESVDSNKLFTLIEIISSTGLQIKMDPGIPIIYLGFFFLMVSILMSYVTYSQIWILKDNEKIFIGGNTNRAIFEFELEFFKFIN